MARPSPKHIALRYMTGFECIGPTCEETCCATWKVQIDEGHYRKLKKLMDAPGDRETFARAFTPNTPPARSASHFAVINMVGDDSRCLFLDERKLCSIHARWGEKAIPDVCSTYPRWGARVGKRVEISGALSCPEVARRCLLAEDACDLVEVAPSLAPRIVGEELPDIERAEPYFRHLDTVRGTVLELLSLRQYPMRARLFFVAHLARELSEFLRPGQLALDEDRLADAIALGERPALLDALYGELRATRVDGVLACALLMHVLAAPLRQGTRASFERVLRRVMEVYVADPASGVRAAGDGQNLRVSPEALLAAYDRRKTAHPVELRDRVDVYFENYAKNQWMKESYVHAPDLATYTQNLLVRVAILRFLVMSDPVWDGLAGLDEAEARRRLDAAAVEVFYTFTRNIEHNQALLDGIGQVLEELGATGLVHALALLQI